MRRAAILVVAACGAPAHHAAPPPKPQHVRELHVVEPVMLDEDRAPADLPTVACDDAAFSVPMEEPQPPADNGFVFSGVTAFHAGCASESFLAAGIRAHETELKRCFDSTGAGDRDVVVRLTWDGEHAAAGALVEDREDDPVPQELVPCVAGVLQDLTLDTYGQDAQLPLTIDVDLERGHGSEGGVMAPPPP